MGSGLSGIGPKWDRAHVRRAVSICASHVAFVDSRALPRRCTLRCCRARLDDPSSLLAPVRTPLKRLCSVCIEPLPRPYATLCFASLHCRLRRTPPTMHAACDDPCRCDLRRRSRVSSTLSRMRSTRTPRQARPSTLRGAFCAASRVQPQRCSPVRSVPPSAQSAPVRA